MTRVALGIVLYITSIVGIGHILTILLFPTPYVVGLTISSLIYISYVSLWYKEQANAEQEYQKSIMHEDRIPVIGAKPIDWEDYRDIPKWDINTPIPDFDRNKIGYLYEPNKPIA